MSLALYHYKSAAWSAWVASSSLNLLCLCDLSYVPGLRDQRPVEHQSDADDFDHTFWLLRQNFDLFAAGLLLVSCLGAALS